MGFLEGDTSGRLETDHRNNDGAQTVGGTFSIWKLKSCAEAAECLNKMNLVFISCLPHYWVEPTQDQNIFCSVTSVACCLQHTFYCSKCLLTSQWWCSLGKIEDFFEQALLFIEQVPKCNETLVDKMTPACSIFWWILFFQWMSFTLNCRYSGASYLHTGYMV